MNMPAGSPINLNCRHAQDDLGTWYEQCVFCEKEAGDCIHTQFSECPDCNEDFDDCRCISEEELEAARDHYYDCKLDEMKLERKGRMR